MRTIVHLSDLHFGRVDAAIVEPLVRFIRTANPDLIAVSGDFTQRARAGQFQDARRFLERLPFPQLVVPGNHDIPLRNPFARFLWPLAGYRRHISAELCPTFRDAEIVVVGLNTARSLTTKYGRISADQLVRMGQAFENAGDEATRIVVTHHPFDLPPDYAERRQLVGRAEAAMLALAASRVDLLLAGHLHVTHTGLTATRYHVAGHSALVVIAGTALSTRGRGEANSFNLLRVEPGRIAVERILWDPQRQSLSLAVASRFERGSSGWQRAAVVRPSEPTVPRGSSRPPGGGVAPA